MLYRVFALLLLAMAATPWPTAGQNPARGPALQKGARVAVVVLNDSVRARMALDDLTSFLQRSLAAVVRRYPADASLSALEEDAILVFGPSESGSQLERLAGEAGIKMDTTDLGVEGSRVKSATVGRKPVVFLAGKSVAGACHAVYSFLETEVGIGFFIDGDRVPERTSIDLGGLDRKEIPAVPIRGIFYHPTWKHPQATSWRLWSWEGSKEFIDWMRRKRFNTLPLFHDEGGYLWGDVIFKTFPRLKINDRSLDQFVVDPAWRTELNKKMFRYARESGIQIAYNLFYSQVPEFFA